MMEAYRGQLIHFLGDPKDLGEESAHRYYPDGLLLVADGRVVEAGPAEKLLDGLSEDVRVEEFPDCLILPGFVDAHVHYPQTEMIASYGEQLLEWLENYTFPTERGFESAEKAAAVAEFFLGQLLRNGTTTAMALATVHPESVEGFFEAALDRGMRVICGKVMMDRNAPEYLLDTPETGYADSKKLIEKYFGRGRLGYAVTPRFAPTSTPEQLEKAGQLLREYPGVYMQTHLSENKAEVDWVQELFPDCDGYLDVYDRSGLLGPTSVFAHSVHLSDLEFARLGETGSGIAHCPTSNLFLGSGLFNLEKADEYGVGVGLGTDVGAGTSFSQLQTGNEAYKVQQLRRTKLSPFRLLYMATLGGARMLGLERAIGNFEPGKEADFTVLDLQATELARWRVGTQKTLQDQLFVLFMLGDDRWVKATYLMGRRVYEKVG